MVIRDRNPVVCRLGGFQDDVTTDLILSCTAIGGTTYQRGAFQRHPEVTSCHQQDLVTNKVKANSIGPRPIEKERRGRLKHIPAQFIPRIRFGEDVFSKAFGAVAAVSL